MMFIYFFINSNPELLASQLTIEANFLSSVDI